MGKGQGCSPPCGAQDRDSSGPRCREGGGGGSPACTASPSAPVHHSSVGALYMPLLKASWLHCSLNPPHPVWQSHFSSVCVQSSFTDMAEAESTRCPHHGGTSGFPGRPPPWSCAWGPAQPQPFPVTLALCLPRMQPRCAPGSLPQLLLCAPPHYLKGSGSVPPCTSARMFHALHYFAFLHHTSLQNDLSE